MSIFVSFPETPGTNVWPIHCVVVTLKPLLLLLVAYPIFTFFVGLNVSGRVL